MKCKNGEDCKARSQLMREAFLNRKIAEAVKELGKGAAEVVGVKKKTGAADLKKKQQAKPKPSAPAGKSPDQGKAKEA